MQSRSTRYLIVLSVMWGALSFHWTVLSNNIVPTRVLSFATESNKGTLLGLATVVGALVSMVTAPIAGVLSDESRSRWGRRRPFLAVGIAANSIALLALIGARTLIGFTCAFAAVQLFANLAGSPYTALIPDQVPDLQKGKATGFAGFAEVVGRLAGAVAGGLMISLPAVALVLGSVLVFLPQPLRGDPMLPIILLTIAVTVGAMLFTLVQVEEDLSRVSRGRQTHILWHAFTFDVRAESSFAWLLAARGCRMLAINTLVTFLLYYVRDYLGVTDLNEANAKLGYLFAVSSITTLPSALIVGYLIDRYQHRKLWVYASCAGLALVCVAFILIRQFSQALAVGAAFGLCYGAYFTSDWALALSVLPKGDEAAKYMGMWGLAGTFPQVLAPGIGGVLLDTFNRLGPNWGYPAVFVTEVLYLLAGTVLLVKVTEPEGPTISAAAAAAGERARRPGL
ncbi:MAG: MFS transporter [Candidatus Binatia bacterium]